MRQGWLSRQQIHRLFCFPRLLFFFSFVYDHCLTPEFIFPLPCSLQHRQHPEQHPAGTSGEHFGPSHIPNFTCSTHRQSSRTHTLSQFLSLQTTEGICPKTLNLQSTVAVTICTPFPFPDAGGLQTMNHFNSYSKLELPPHNCKPPRTSEVAVYILLSPDS